MRFIAKEGLISDRLSIVDSTHVKAKVDTFKMQNKPDHVKDRDAKYGYKTQNKPFFGYKAHTGIDADSELITKVETTPGNVHDGEVFRKVADVKAEIIAAQRERPKIERKFAELKRVHGLAVARYWGLAKMSIQSFMAAITCNLKRMVKLTIQQRDGIIFIPLRVPEGITMPI